MNQELTLPLAAAGLVRALLVGLILGAQRESAQDERQAGLRDFIVIALSGGLCGLLDEPWLTIPVLLSVTALLAVFHWRAGERTGITTELAGVATFLLGLMAAGRAPVPSKLALAAAIVLVAFLEAKRGLHRLVRTTITETEFNDTIWFLAIIFVIHPLLPEGGYGPYGAIRPRQIWLFVILVSTISYVGYFLQKFLGTRRGLTLTAGLGGLASTTAATLALAREERDDPASSDAHWYAAVLANAIQFPRVLILVAAIHSGLALRLAPVLLTMMAAGLVFGYVLYRRVGHGPLEKQIASRNPFRLAPALKFGALFALVMLASEAATNQYGGRGLYWAGVAGGAVDADAVSVTLAELCRDGAVAENRARSVLLIALLMNALLKTGLAASGGGRRFGGRVAAGFAVMFAAGAAVLLAV